MPAAFRRSVRAHQCAVSRHTRAREQAATARLQRFRAACSLGKKWARADTPSEVMAPSVETALLPRPSTRRQQSPPTPASPLHQFKWIPSATSPRTGETEADASRLAWPVPRRGTRLPGAWASGATAAHARQRASSPSPRDRGRDGTTRGRYLPAIAEAPRSQPCLKAGAPPPKR